jgi:hypothetical protein
MNRHQIYAVVVCFLALVVSAKVANAQSKDKDSPTQLTSGEISGLLGDNAGDDYFYTFMAGPGEVTVTMSVEAGRDSSSSAVTFHLFNDDDKPIATSAVFAFRGQTAREVKRISFTRRRRVLLRVSIPDEVLGSGKYKVSLDGAVTFASSTGGSVADLVDSINKTQDVRCLPPKGTLVIKMKDGSKKIIDLSEAETVTVVP